VGHHFDDPDLLEQALTHRSFVAEHPGTGSYERLEFLGDAVLQLSVTRYLYRQHPELAEGEMAKVRAAVVSEPALARFAEEFHIAPALRLGRGEEMTGGRHKESLLSDVVESVIGAFYIEAGIDVVHDFVVAHWADTIEERVTAPGRGDFKTRLQEVLAKQGKRPEYRLIEDGPPHARTFVARVLVDGETIGIGEGTSKKRAQQEAARTAIGRIT
jgi:ribonuclease III